MSEKLGWARIVLAGVLAVGCAAVLPPKALGQESASEAAKRKVKANEMPDNP